MAQGGKGSKKMLLGLAIGLVVAGGGAGGAFMLLGKAKAHGPETVEPGPVYKMNTLVVNLREPGLTRYLKTALELELDAKKDVERAQKFATHIRHQVIMYLSSLTLSEIQAEGGRQTIIGELGNKIRAAMPGGKLRRVYFTDFVIQ